MLWSAGLVLLALNGAFFWWRFNAVEREMLAEWVVLMPDLEASQRDNPMNFLESSHIHDPRYPVLNGLDDGNVLMKAAHSCAISQSYLAHYFGVDANGKQPLQMPDRLFLPRLSTNQARCLGSKVPKGYQLARLKRSVSPKFVGWGANDLELSPLVRPETNRPSHAQTH